MRNDGVRGGVSFGPHSREIALPPASGQSGGRGSEGLLGDSVAGPLGNVYN
jgi:hypothetical protein